MLKKAELSKNRGNTTLKIIIKCDILESIRDRIGGGDRPREGRGVILAVQWPSFGADGAEQWELLEIFGENWVKWPIFDAAGAENFEIFRYFSEKSPNFVKVEDFIA